MQRMRRAFGYKPDYVIALERKVGELMFDGDGERLTVSDNESKLTVLMSAFTEYEMKVSHNSILPPACIEACIWLIS